MGDESAWLRHRGAAPYTVGPISVWAEDSTAECIYIRELSLSTRWSLCKQGGVLYCKYG